MSKPSITSTNLRSLTELMISENLQYKKCKNYLSQVDDADLKASLTDMSKRHKKRYQGLLDYLNQHQ